MENENSVELEEKIEEVNSANSSSEESLMNVPQNDIKEPLEQEDVSSDIPATKKLTSEKKLKLQATRRVCKVLYIIMLSVLGAVTLLSTMVGAIYVADKMLSYEEEIDIDESFILDDLTDKDIITKDEYYIADSEKYITNGFDFSDADYEYDAYDRAECYFEAKNFSGIKTISVSCAEQSYIVLTVNPISDSDNVKVVITSETEILTTMNANESLIYTVESDGSQQIFVKVMGDEADVEVTVTRTIKGYDENPDL